MGTLGCPCTVPHSSAASCTPAATGMGALPFLRACTRTAQPYLPSCWSTEEVGATCIVSLGLHDPAAVYSRAHLDPQEVCKVRAVPSFEQGMMLPLCWSPSNLETACFQPAGQVPAGRGTVQQVSSSATKRGRVMGHQGEDAHPSTQPVTAAADQALCLTVCLCADCYFMQKGIKRRQQCIATRNVDLTQNLPFLSADLLPYERPPTQNMCCTSSRRLRKKRQKTYNTEHTVLCSLPTPG